ncbi:hypothetical protein BT96DRAFT_1009752 [Gymnopus androsaceus JB14]|nr:hypothetical protein BT96DRAFT_1009752 [Gymnopus androsaceus JB14]
MLLLAIARRQTGPEPAFALCLIQGALIYASPIWLMASACAFALQFHLTVLYYVKQYTGIISHRNKWLPLSTIILFIQVTIVLLAIGLLNPQIVQREQFYCHFTNDVGVYAVSLFSVAFATIAVTFEYKSGKLLYQHWKNKAEYYHKSNGTVSFGVMIRLAGFSLLSILSVATCALYILPSLKNFDNLIVYNALLSNIDVLLLGLNMSIIRAWMFWNNGKFGSPQVHVEVKVEQSV